MFVCRFFLGYMWKLLFLDCFVGFLNLGSCVCVGFRRVRNLIG